MVRDLTGYICFVTLPLILSWLLLYLKTLLLTTFALLGCRICVILYLKSFFNLICYQPGVIGFALIFRNRPSWISPYYSFAQLSSKGNATPSKTCRSYRCYCDGYKCQLWLRVLTTDENILMTSCFPPECPDHLTFLLQRSVIFKSVCCKLNTVYISKTLCEVNFQRNNLC